MAWHSMPLISTAPSSPMTCTESSGNPLHHERAQRLGLERRLHRHALFDRLRIMASALRLHAPNPADQVMGGVHEVDAGFQHDAATAPGQVASPVGASVTAGPGRVIGGREIGANDAKALKSAFEKQRETEANGAHCWI